MLTLFLCAVLLSLLCFWLWLVTPYQWRSFKVYEIINRIPGPKSYPFIGNTLHFHVPNYELPLLLWKDFQEYGSIFRVWMCGVPYVFLSDPDDVEMLLKSRTEITKSDSYEFLEGLMGHSLGNSHGELWHSQRRMLDPAFHSDNLRDYVHVFNVNSKILVDNLAAHQGDDWVDIQKWIALCSLDILCDAVMGVPLGAQHGGHVEYVRAIHRICEIISHRMFSPWLYRPLSNRLSPSGREEARVLDVIHKFADKVIKEKRMAAENLKAEELTSGSKQRPNLLELLLSHCDEKGLLSDRDIGYQVATFMFVGHDTSTVSICWVLFLLASYPEIQDKVVEELNEILGDSDCDPKFADLNNMKYMERVIKEALRLYPGVPTVARKLEEDMEVKGYTIPAGSNVTVYSYVVHRNPDIYPDPETFDPDRFLPENVEGRHPYAYIPFSSGPRNCIGQRFAMLEEKAMLACILRRFRVTSLDKREDMRALIELVLRPWPKIRMRLTPRT